MRSLSAIFSEVKKTDQERALSSVGRASRLHRECDYSLTLYSQGFYKLQIFSVPIPYQLLNSKAFQALSKEK